MNKHWLKHLWLWMTCAVFAVGTISCDDGGGGDNGGSGSMEMAGDDGSDASDDTGANAGDSGSADDNAAGDMADPAPSGPFVVAVGDSITAGSEPGSGEPYPNTVAGIIGEPIANLARPGERAAVAANRMSGLLAQFNEDRVMIMYGTNDILGGFPISTAVDGLRSIVRNARSNGATPYLATIPPMRGSVARNQPNVDALNGGIRSLASSEGAVLVDVARLFGSGDGLMLSDGFHPNSQGSRVIANAFASALR